MSLPWLWARRTARLARHVPAPSMGAVLGDVLEEYGDRLAHRGRVRAELWLAAELWSLTRAYRRSALGPSPTSRAWLVRPAEFAQTVRALGRAPWYTLTLAGVIALSMALGTTVFAVVDGALFKPLPYRQPDRLFVLALGHSELPDPPRAFAQISEAELREWASAFPDVRLTGWPASRFQVVGVRDSVRSAEVDAAFFDVIGMRPATGGFAASDFDAAGPVRPALITHDFWRVRFAGAPSAIGQTLVDDNGRGIRVAGILPPDFVFPRPADRQFVPELLLPRPATPARPGALTVLVRLESSVTREEAESRLTALAARWAADHPAPPAAPGTPERTRILSGPYDRVALKPIDDELTSGIAERARLVFGVAPALMLLAVLNVTSLAITRVRDRWRDLTVRRALGARFGDLARLLAIENTVIVVAGAAGGIVACSVLLPITLRLIGGAYLVVIKPPAIDTRVLAFSALAAFACVAVVTLRSARAAMRTNWTDRPEWHHGGRRALITIEVAVALVIAVGGSLLAGSLIRVWDEDPGFDVTNAAVVTMAAPPDAAGSDVERLVAEINRLPGVQRAGGAANLILDRALYDSAFDHPAGFVAPPPGSLDIESVAITHGYLESAGLTPRVGRLLTDEEFATGAPLVVVSERVAHSYWPDRSAIGEVLVSKGRPFTVVGVVPDARYLSLDRDPAGQIYWPTAAAPAPHLATLLIRFDPDAPAPLAATAARIAGLCPACRIVKSDMLIDRLAESIRPRMFNAWLFSTFGVAALVIVGVGVLGIVAMTTNRRTREIGIRMALGATAGSVTRQIVGEHVRAVVLGLVIGGVAAAYIVRFLESYLYKTTVYDPWSWVAAIATLLVISVVAAFVPSRRASGVDPARVLRVE